MAMAGLSQMLEKKISEIEKLASEDDPSAFSKAAVLIGEYPNDPRVWSLRAYVLARQESFAAAIEDLSKAIELSLPEPVYHFDRGRYFLRMGDSSSAVNDFSVGLDLCDKYDSDYYRETFHFLRADALLSLGKKDEALWDLSHVSDEFVLWTTELRSKEQLVALCY
jgi:tetratricopeptide (TPR) repeat protein